MSRRSELSVVLLNSKAARSHCESGWVTFVQQPLRLESTDFSLAMRSVSTSLSCTHTVHLLQPAANVAYCTSLYSTVLHCTTVVHKLSLCHGCRTPSLSTTKTPISAAAGPAYADITRLDLAAAPAPLLRQEVLQVQRREQSEFVDASFAPVERMSEAFRAPVPGVAPYM